MDSVVSAIDVAAAQLPALGGRSVEPGRNYSALFIAAIMFGVLGGVLVLPIKSVK